MLKSVRRMRSPNHWIFLRCYWVQMPIPPTFFIQLLITLWLMLNICSTSKLVASLRVMFKKKALFTNCNIFSFLMISNPLNLGMKMIKEKRIKRIKWPGEL